MTTRQFKLYGTQDAGSTGTISIDGNVILDGAFGGNTDVLTSILASGSLTFDDSEETVHPIEISVTSGQLQVGLLEWTSGRELNRLLTSEEFTELVNFDTLVTDVVALLTSKGVPTPTAEDIAKFDPTDMSIYQKIITTTREEMTELQTILYNYRVSAYYRYDDNFSIVDIIDGSWEQLVTTMAGSPTPEEQEIILSALSTRSDPLLNGELPSNAFTDKFVTVPAGSVLTFGAIVFNNAPILLWM